MTKLAFAPLLAAAMAFTLVPAGAGAAAPTCATTLGIANHGEHIVADYITAIGRDNMDWPPPAGEVGSTVSENGGAMVPGAPGPGSHFPQGFAPGASFCLLQSQSPGFHPGP